jgi:hypothetical protein
MPPPNASASRQGILQFRGEFAEPAMTSTTLFQRTVFAFPFVPERVLDTSFEVLAEVRRNLDCNPSWVEKKQEIHEDLLPAVRRLLGGKHAIAGRAGQFEGHGVADCWHASPDYVESHVWSRLEQRFQFRDGADGRIAAATCGDSAPLDPDSISVAFEDVHLLALQSGALFCLFTATIRMPSPARALIPTLEIQNEVICALTHPRHEGEPVFANDAANVLADAVFCDALPSERSLLPPRRKPLAYTFLGIDGPHLSMEQRRAWCLRFAVLRPTRMAREAERRVLMQELEDTVHGATKDSAALFVEAAAPGTFFENAFRKAYVQLWLLGVHEASFLTAMSQAASDARLISSTSWYSYRRVATLERHLLSYRLGSRFCVVSQNDLHEQVHAFFRRCLRVDELEREVDGDIYQVRKYASSARRQLLEIAKWPATALGAVWALDSFLGLDLKSKLLAVVHQDLRLLGQILVIACALFGLSVLGAQNRGPIASLLRLAKVDSYIDRERIAYSSAIGIVLVAVVFLVYLAFHA